MNYFPYCVFWHKIAGVSNSFNNTTDLEEPGILTDDLLHHAGQAGPGGDVQGVVDGLLPYLERCNRSERERQGNYSELTTLGVITMARLLGDILFLSSSLLTSWRNLKRYWMFL